MTTKRMVRVLIATAVVFAGPAVAGEEDDILVLLDEFLANASVKSAHERFWDNELVYTSSAGTRTDKASILASFDGADESADGNAGPVYTAEDVRLSRYGDTAVVAFKLVATPPGDAPQLFYFNTGTFVKRDDGWRVVAWQATKIPPEE